MFKSRSWNMQNKEGWLVSLPVACICIISPPNIYIELFDCIFNKI